MKRNRLFLRLVSSDFTRSVGILASGTALAQAIGLLTTPIVSRLYDPADFGEFALVSAIAVVLSAVIALGLQSAIVKAPTEEDSRRVLSVSTVVSTLLATSALVALLVISPVAQFGDSGLPYVVACLLVWALAVFTNVNGSLRSYANRRGLNKVLFTNSLIGATTTLLVTVPLGLVGAGALGLIAGALASALVCNIQMVVRLRPFQQRIVRADVSEVFRENRAFVAFQYPANLIENLSAQAPRLALSPLFGSAAIGLYAMTDKLLGAPLRLLGAPIGTVYFREASKRSLAGEDLAPFTFRLVMTIMALGYVPLVVIVLWGEPLLAWMLGSEWAGAGALASIFIVRYLFVLTRTCVGTARVVMNRQPANLMMSVLRLAIEVGALILGAVVTEDVMETFFWFAAASTLFYMLDMTLTFRVLGRFHWQYLAGASAYVASIAVIWLGTSAI